jgi:hypothetical protein
MDDEKEAMPKNRAHAVLQGKKVPDCLQVAKGSKTDDAAEADKKKPNFTTETLLSRALRLGCNLDAALDRRQEKHIRLLRQLHELIDKHRRETDASAHERHSYLSELYESLARALEAHEACLAQRQPSVDTTEQALRSFKPDQIFEYWTTIDGWASEGHSPIAKRQTAELHAVIEQLAVYEDVYTNKHLTQNDLIDAIVEQSRGAIERRTRRRKSRLQNIDLRATKSALANAAVRTQTFQKLRDQLDAVNAHIEKELANPGNLNESDTRTSTASIALILKELLGFQNANKTQAEEVGKAVVQAVESDRAQTNDGDNTEDSILMRTIRTSLASAGSEDESAGSGDPSSETDRLANLVSIERWEVTFRDRLRDEPTLGARLGLPLDLDNSAFTRLVTDIARHVQLPGEFCCPIALIEERIEELRGNEESRDTWRTTLDESRKMKLEDYDIAYLDENRIGPKFWGRIAQPPPAQEGSPRASDEEDLLKDQFKKEWGGKSIGAYLQWMRDSTIDLEKVRTYFLCDHSKGACRTVEEELRSELKQLPFTSYEDRGPDESSRDSHVSHFPMHPGRQRDIPLDRAMIEFGDRMVSVYSNLAQGVVNSEGWLFFPAGRGPQHQLIGETVARYKGDLERLVWMQYAALNNPRLGGAENHSDFVKQLRDSSVELTEAGEKTAELTSHVFYPSDKVLYPSIEDVQGLVCDDDGKEVSAQDWLREKVQVIEDLKGDLHLHPHCTHLIFWDTEGEIRKTAGSRPLEQPLPYEHIEAVEKLLRTEGVAEGLVIANGDEQDFELAKHQVAQSDPVLSLKSIGGSSDFMASIFTEFTEERSKQTATEATLREEEEFKHVERDRLLGLVGKGRAWGKYQLQKEAKKHDVYAELEDDEDIEELIELICVKRLEAEKKRLALRNSDGRRSTNRKLPESQLQEKFRQGEHLNDKFKPRDGHKGKFYFKPRGVCDETEMITIDVAPEQPGDDDAGEKIQKQLAQMLSMQGDERERVLGFAAAEHQFMSTAWDEALHYGINAQTYRVAASTMAISMLVINLMLVAIVVFKQAMYPGNHHTGCAAYVHDGKTHVRDGAHESLADEVEEMEDGDTVDYKLLFFKIGLTMMPILNGIFLTLDNAFTPTHKRNALLWTQYKLESELYQYRTRACKYSPVNTSASWSFMVRQAQQDGASSDSDGQPQGKQIASKTFVQTVAAVAAVRANDGVFVRSHLSFPDKHVAAKRRAAFIKELKSQPYEVQLEEVDTATEDKAPKTVPFHDNGYDQLDAQQYIACRTLPLLERYKQELPWLGRQDMLFVRTTRLLLT